MTRNTSKLHIKQAKALYKRHDTKPFYVKRARGIYLYDFDQNKYIDFCLNEGSLILGHCNPKINKALKNSLSKGYIYAHPTPLEHRLAKLIIGCYTKIETIRFIYSQLEQFSTLFSVVSNNEDNYNPKSSLSGEILFVGKGYKDLLFNGHFDNFAVVEDFDSSKIESIINTRKDLAAICMEPVATRGEFKIHSLGFLKSIQDICIRCSKIFIMDESNTAFRLSIGGAAEYFGLSPDLTLLGSVIGGGFPLYAIGGRNELFRSYESRDLYQPLAYTAGIETIKMLKRLNPYQHFSLLMELLTQRSLNYDTKIEGIVSLFSLKFSRQYSLLDIVSQTTDAGFLINPDIGGTQYLSPLHTESEVNKLLKFVQHL